MVSLPRHRTVSDVMTRGVHVASPATPFKLVVRLIEENHVSAIPIVDGLGLPLGIVSESDLMLKERRHGLASKVDLVHLRRRRQLQVKADAIVASDLMTAPAITVVSDASLTQAARLMQEHNVRRLVVVDANGKIAGIVSRSDLLQVFLRTDEELREEIVNQVVPAILWPAPDDLVVTVVWNVVTLTGQVDRRSDAQILSRLVRELDGVVGVEDRLTYLWDDTTATPDSALRSTAV